MTLITNRCKQLWHVFYQGFIYWVDLETLFTVVGAVYKCFCYLQVVYKLVYVYLQIIFTRC